MTLLNVFSLNNLPDLALIRIFDFFTLTELINFRLVCHRWADLLVPSVLRKRQTLTVFGQNCLEYYSNAHSLRCDRLAFFGIHQYSPSFIFDLLLDFCSPNFRSEVNAHLIDYMPNIKKLTVVHYNITEKNQANLGAFLENWPQTLTELHFVGLRSGSYNWTLFAAKLDQLTSLHTLSIDVNISRLKDLRIFSNLKSLNCRFVLADRVETNLYSQKLPNELLSESKTGNVSGNSLQRIGFYVDNNSGFLNCISKEEAVKVDRLAIIVGFVSQLKLLSTKCVSLSYLDLTFYDNESNIDCFLGALVRLQKLTHFRLFLSPLHNYFMKICNQNVGTLPKLPAIRQVELQFPVEPHKFDLIEKIFPNALEVVIHIEQYLFSDYRQLLCGGCKRCKVIAEKINKIAEVASSSLKFGFKNGVIL